MEPKDNLKPIEFRPLIVGTHYVHSIASQNSYLIEKYHAGEWNYIIEHCEYSIANIVDSFPNPELTPYGSSVTKLYVSSQAYRAKGEKDKYIACLKILYSLSLYRLNLGGTEYQNLVATAANNYISLSEDVGINYLNNFQVTGLFKKKSGCFIATVAYESPLANEVLILKQFRDDILLQNRIGKIFVNTYYHISPSIAIIIGKFSFTIRITRALLYPLVKLIKYLF